MKVKLVLARTMWDPEMTWKDTRIFEVEIPLDKQDPDNRGCYNVVGCYWPEEAHS